VDHRHVPPVVLDGVPNGGADEPLRAVAGNRLNAHAAGFGKADFLEPLREVFGEQLQKPVAFLGPLLEFDPCVDVLGVLAEDDHINLLRAANRRGHAGKVADGPEADVEVQGLAKRHVQRANAAAHGGGERPFNADQEFLERFDGVLRKPFSEAVVRRFACVDLEPSDSPGSSIGLFHRGIQDPLRGGPDIRPGAVASNEGQNRILRDLEPTLDHANFAALRRRDVSVVHKRCCLCS